MKSGQLAFNLLGISLELTVLKSAAGFYIGTFDGEGPVSRESLEYYASEDAAQDALDGGTFTQREHP